MPSRVVLLLPHRPVRQVILDPEMSYLIGRGPDCRIRLDDSRLSRRHAKLFHDGRGWVIRDLDSKNGVLVEGRKTREASLEHGAWLSLGGVLARYQELSEDALRSEEQSARELRDTTRDMVRGLDPRVGVSALLDQVLDNVLSLTGLGRGFVMLTDDDGRLRLVLKRSLSEDQLAGDEFSGSWGAIRLALEQRQALISNDTSGSETLGDRPSIVQGGIRSLACVPLETGGRIMGLVYADSEEVSRQFTELDVELLGTLCNQAAIALGVARVSSQIGSLRERLEAAMQDPGKVVRLLRDRLPAYRSPADEVELARTALGGNR